MGFFRDVQVNFYWHVVVTTSLPPKVWYHENNIMYVSTFFCHFAPTCPKSDDFKKKALKKDQRPKGWNLQHSFFSGRVLQPTTNKQKHCTLIGKLRKKKIQAEIHHFGLIESLRGLRFNVALQIFSNGKCYRKCRQLGKKSQQWFSQTFAGWKSESEFSWNRIEAGQPCVRSWDIKKRFFFIRDPD